MAWLRGAWRNSRHKGEHYEREAEDYLRKQGLKSHARNYHCKFGEIDLIMHDGETLVFVEVKYRKSDHYGGADYALSQHKLERIQRTIEHYLQRHRTENCPLRVDFVAINGQNSNQFNWIKNVLDADYARYN